MQDDAYMISRDGWKVTITLPRDKKGNVKKNYTYEEVSCDLLPSKVLMSACFADELSNINMLEVKIETIEEDMNNMAEEYSDSFADFFNDKNAVKLSEVKAVLKSAKKDSAQFDKSDIERWTKYVALADEMDKVKKNLKEAVAELTKAVQDKYAILTEDEVRELVFVHKWMSTMRERLTGLMTACQQRVSSDMHILNARYENTLEQLAYDVKNYESAVMSHLKEMGF
jgi:hypothetical protein